MTNQPTDKMIQVSEQYVRQIVCYLLDQFKALNVSFTMDDDVGRRVRWLAYDLTKTQPRTLAEELVQRLEVPVFTYLAHENGSYTTLSGDLDPSDSPFDVPKRLRDESVRHQLAKYFAPVDLERLAQDTNEPESVTGVDSVFRTFPRFPRLEQAVRNAGEKNNANALTRFLSPYTLHADTLANWMVDAYKKNQQRSKNDSEFRRREAEYEASCPPGYKGVL